MPNRMSAPGDHDGEDEMTPEQSEAQMRRALETLSNSPQTLRASPPAPRPGDPQPFVRPVGNKPSFGQPYAAPAARKHRFVQDGEVQVVHLPLQKDRPRDAPPPMAEQRAARERTERTLMEAQSMIRGMQTKLAHAEIALREAVQRANVQAEAANTVRAELQQARSEAQAAEHAKQSLERKLADQTAALQAEIERLRQAAAAPVVVPAPVMPVPVAAEIAPVPAAVSAFAPVPVAKLRKPRQPRQPRVVPVELEAEPEPVKWWLASKPLPVRTKRTRKGD